MAAGKPPAKKAAPKKAAAPRKRASRAHTKPPEPTEDERAQARAQIASITPIRGGRRSADPRHSPGSPQALLLTERRQRALNLRRLGLQWAQVAAEVLKDERFARAAPKYGAADAYNDARALVDSVTVESVQAVREDDLALLLSLQRVIYPRALEGDVKALDRMLAILDRRAKYLGLDAPIRLQLPTEAAQLDIDTSDDAAIYGAALAALDDSLPHLDPLELPGASGEQ
jgi:hypothetical protein